MKVPVGGGKEESAEDKARWKAFRQFVRESKVRKDSTFEIPGYIKSMTGDPNNPGQPRYVEGKGEIKAKYVLDAICVSTHPSFPGLEWKKPFALSFFNGQLRGGGTGNKGGMYVVHYAVTGQEPSQALQTGKGEFDPEEDYCGPDKPVMLRLIYRGQVEEDSQYYGRRGNLSVFLDGLDPAPDKIASEWDDDTEEDDERELVGVGAASASSDEKDPWDE